MTRHNGDRQPHDAAIDPEAMRRAEDVIEQLRWTYIREWAPAAMRELEAATQHLRQAVAADDAAGSEEARDAILRLTHDMKGQAGTFGLDLLQDFAASLHRFASPQAPSGLRQAELCQSHVAAMHTALADASCQPDGLIDGQLERELREGLRELARLRFN